MPRILLAVLALALSAGAAAQLYKSIDKDGRVIYSDQPPADANAKSMAIKPAPAGPSQRSALERDKELEKLRQAERDKGKTSDETAKRAKENEERCQAARSQMLALDSGRVSAVDAKGERYFLDEAQIETERAKMRKAMEESCKGS